MIGSNMVQNKLLAVILSTCVLSTLAQPVALSCGEGLSYDCLNGPNNVEEMNLAVDDASLSFQSVLQALGCSQFMTSAIVSFQNVLHPLMGFLNMALRRGCNSEYCGFEIPSVIIGDDDVAPPVMPPSIQFDPYDGIPSDQIGDIFGSSDDETGRNEKFIPYIPNDSNQQQEGKCGAEGQCAKEDTGDGDDDDKQQGESGHQYGGKLQEGSQHASQHASQEVKNSQQGSQEVKNSQQGSQYERGGESGRLYGGKLQEGSQHASQFVKEGESGGQYAGKQQGSQHASQQGSQYEREGHIAGRQQSYGRQGQRGHGQEAYKDLKANY